MSDYPRRAVEVTLRICGDDDEAIRQALHQIETEMILRNGPPRIDRCVSGGYNSGWTIEVERRPEQTHEKWEADLHAYLESLRAPDGAKHARGES